MFRPRAIATLALMAVLLGALSASSTGEAAAPRALVARGPGLPLAVVLDDVPELLDLMLGLDPVAATEVAPLLDDPAGFDAERLCCAGWEEEITGRMSTPPVSLTLCWRATEGGVPDCAGLDVQRASLYPATEERPAWLLLRRVDEGGASTVRRPDAAAIAILERHGIPTRVDDRPAPAGATALGLVALLVVLAAGRKFVGEDDRTNV